MRFPYLVAFTALTVGAAVAASAQAQSASVSSTHKKVFGYQDTQTGTFHPLVHAEPETTPAPITGKYVLTFTITIASTFPAKSVIVCAADILAASINDTTGAGVTYEEIATTDVTLAGTTATCKVTVPYSWAIPAASGSVQNQVSGTYSVTVLDPATTSITLASVEGLRSSTGDLLIPTTVPAHGATTSETVDVTL
jgi:hypothetical protein